MSKNLAAKFLVVALATLPLLAQGAVIDETGPAAGAPIAGPATANPPMGALENRAMRTKSSLGAVQAAFDNSDPRSNVERFKYDPAMTYKLRTREYMAVTVVLPPGEAIDGYMLPDKHNFTFTPYSAQDCKGKCDEPDRLANVFSITPIYPGADTNLTVFGRSSRIYSFYIRVDSVSSPHLPHLLAYVDDINSLAGFTAPQGASKGTNGKAPSLLDKAVAEVMKSSAGTEKMTGEDAADLAEYLRKLPVVDPKSINLNAYKVVDGDKALAPIRVFDDGYWTYFQYSREGNLDKVKVPAIYRVVDGYDTPANIRVEGGTIIAETTSQGWTIRSGEAHLCVRAKK